MNGVTQTPAALQQWSSSNRQLPPVERIKEIHIYDFDNTLFSSPLPNKQLWNPSTIGSLQRQDFLYNGGWWHNSRILSATGEGVAKEEARAWQGSWNEKIVELARMSAADDQVLNILLTGRSQAGFPELLTRMVNAKGLQFDMLCLKPEVSPYGQQFDNTLEYKTTLLEDMIRTYKNATELRMYEDRPKHTKSFRNFFEQLNTRLREERLSGTLPARNAFAYEVVQVSEGDSVMNPVNEVAEVQTMINKHNQSIQDGSAPSDSKRYKLKRTVLYTGYLISPVDVARLKSLVPPRIMAHQHNYNFFADNIMITTHPLSTGVLNKIGGMGAHMRWRVTGIGQTNHSCAIAARVAPMIPGANIHTLNKTPYVVLAVAHNKKASQASNIRDWTATTPEQAFEFDSVIGEKVQLAIVEDRVDGGYAPSAISGNARKHPRVEDFPALGAEKTEDRPSGPRAQQHGAWSNGTKGGQAAGQHGQGRGGRNDRQGGRGGRSRHDRQQNRGGNGSRGGRGAYRSLDANPGQGYGMGGMEY